MKTSGPNKLVRKDHGLSSGSSVRAIVRHGVTRLIKSTEDLIIGGQSMRNVPLFTLGDGDILIVPSLWSIYCARDRCYSLKTTWTYARGLCLFLNSQSVAAPGVGWERTTKDDVIRFKQEMGLQGNDPGTINVRLAALDNFFEWGVTNGFLSARPFRLRNRTSSSSQAVSGDGVPIIGTLALIRKRQPIIESDQFTRIRIENPIRDPLLRKRLDLMFLWGWATGLRAKEVVGISIRCIRKSILDEVQVNTRPSVIKLDVLRMFQTTTSDVFMMDLVPPTTKGGRGGSILVPREIVKATAEWINSSRRFLKIRHEASDCVFIAAHCGSIEPETLEKYFTTAAKRCCVKGSFHSLRHSYATRMTSEFNRLGCPALGALIVQNQLRHGARETTANYVHAAEMQAHAGAVHLAVNRAFL